ncbi:membrane protein insertion efficiency factor YidD [Vagococcus zengguangii]|uniref:Putative membrane protein insertion efficiency factor n=1 Tax=Vagococcus zengguangii TaxID=2571750 RepID=A0A4D7CV11_9ENTE|nr:membrane protein insertion efficiency factor YidD [Vagococcus zengguangii]QCI86177.1 membrane protein insertion efficiency factor YidD [Vagococcus zengguangii]
MKRILINIVRLYQKYISAGTPRSCRYHPTCSAYMIDAITYHGAFKGTVMGVGRICRCHPFIKGGIDYVPKKFTLRRNKNEEYPGPYTIKKQHN